MTGEKQALEVEVVEIDGMAPPPPAPAPDRAATFRIDWQSWNGRIRTLDPRWWPLWVLLGFLAAVLMVTLGVAAAVLYLTFHLLRRLWYGLFPFLASPRNGSIR